MTHLTAAAKLSRFQLVILIICFIMNMCDGMNVMIISYSTNAISKEWFLAPGSFGIVFSAGLLGMAIGAMVLAPRADMIGRKPMILICAIWMSVGVLLTAFAKTISVLIMLRFFTGLGIGSMLACSSAMASEYAPKKTKDFWVSFVMAGYSAGAVFSGLAAPSLIGNHGWRSLFLFAAISTMITIPCIIFILKESVAYLIESQPARALERANRILIASHQSPLSVLPEKKSLVSKISVNSLFQPPLKKSTILLWFCFFLSFAALYFLTSWIPKIASLTGMSPSLSISAGMFFNVGAFAGILTQGFLSEKFGLKKVICVFLIATAVCMPLIGLLKDPVVLLILFCLIGFGVQGGFTGLYSVAAKLYETSMRSTGIGWAIGVGRLGAIIGPFLGGVLLGKTSLALNFSLFAIPLCIAGVLLLFIRLNEK